jgi:hypothetical protein
MARGWRDSPHKCHIGTAMRFDILKQKSIHSVVAITGLLALRNDT